MSGQPYKYHTDINKFRSEYMDALNLQADINSMNLDANKNYKSTGQLPAISQMKETRTTSEILADTEKLKIDLIASIAKISNSAFGQLVVNRLVKNSLNSDNRLLIFTAQRIDDITENLKKIYKYGIKGDENDAEQFVNYITRMYTDKNAFVSQTKAFMDSRGVRTVSQIGGAFAPIYSFLSRFAIDIMRMDKETAEIRLKFIDYNDEYFQYFNEAVGLYSLIEDCVAMFRRILEIIRILKSAIPSKPAEINAIEEFLQKLASERSSNLTSDEELGNISAVKTTREGDIIRGSEMEEFGYEYLDFIKNGLPSVSMLLTIETQLQTYYKQATELMKKTEFPLPRKKMPYKEWGEKFVRSGLIASMRINYDKLIQVLFNVENALQTSEEWTPLKINKMVRKYNLFKREGEPMEEYSVSEEEYVPPTDSAVRDMQLFRNTQRKSENVPSIEELGNPPEQPEEQPEEQQQPQQTQERQNYEDIQNFQYYKDTLQHVLQDTSKYDLTQLQDLINNMNADMPYLKLQLTISQKDIDNGKYTIEQIINSIIQIIDKNLNELGASGSGIIKRRGRPKGSGIKQPKKKYKDIVKSSVSYDKGISETPRFVKFGRYLINMHKLNNEDILAIQRPSGSNISEIPSTKLSKNMSSVIKKMVGGSIPTYSDINNLSESEKAYLHKVSKASNILEKFDIPAPSKDSLEKDIHQFEVMKGEIMAGNDNKDLIKKFKLHIIKLSKNGTLNKKDVSEILEELLMLGY